MYALEATGAKTIYFSYAMCVCVCVSEYFYVFFSHSSLSFQSGICLLCLYVLVLSYFISLFRFFLRVLLVFFMLVLLSSLVLASKFNPIFPDVLRSCRPQFPSHRLFWQRGIAARL